MSIIPHKRKFSNFNPEWQLPFLCRYVDMDGDSQCLICRRHIICKIFNIKRHYELHANDYDQYQGEDRVKLYETLNILKETASMQAMNAKRASYDVVLQLVRRTTTLSDGEFVNTCILEAVKILTPADLYKYKAMDLTRKTISKRVHEMAENTELQLKERIKSLTAYSLAIVECTDTFSIAQLAIFIRGVDAELNVCEELLDIIPVTTETTNGENIYQCANACIQRMGLVWQKVISIVTDGTKSMIDSETGLLASMRQELKREYINENFIAIHCFIHQKALYARSLSASQNVMTVVVKCVNLLRAHGLNQRQFRDLFEFAESDTTDILYANEIRFLRPFFDLRKYIHVLLEEKGAHIPELIDVDWTCDLAFVTDVIQHLSALSNTLMVRNKLIFHMSDEIEAFTQKIMLWQSQLSEKNFVLFPCLKTLAASENLNVNKYVQELENLKKDFEERFAELFKIKAKFEMFVAPFTYDVHDAPGQLQMELIELQCNTRMKAVYRESTCLMEFYQGISMEKFTKLREFAAEIIAMFGSTYMCERFFVLLKINKCRQSKRLSDTEDLRSLMRLAAMQKILPNIEELLTAPAQEKSPVVDEITIKIEEE